MARRKKQSRSLLSPLAENFIKRISSTDIRLRRKVVRYGFIGLGLIFLYSLMSGNYGIPRIIRLEMEKSDLIDANRRQVTALIDATRTRAMLLHDRNYIEFVARTRYHMTYPSETVFYFRR